MTILLTEKGGGGVPFRIGVGACLQDMESRLLLLFSLLRSLAQDRVYDPDSVKIGHESTGRPIIRLSGKVGPFVSFSHSGTRVWAALSWDGPVGIDAACSTEFHWHYPLQRVFTPLEWKAAGNVCGSAKEDRAPLLWTLKEAAVKTIGCGFRSIEPLDVVNFALHRTQGVVRSSIQAGRELSGLALRHDFNQWISIAW
jgi:phosphopantetheinyl transferase